MSKIIDYLKEHPDSTAKTIAEHLDMDKSECNSILYRFLKSKIVKNTQSEKSPLWSLDCYETYEELLNILSYDFQPLRSIVKKINKPKNTINSILYNFQRMGLVEVRKNEDGCKPEWRLI